MKFAVVALIAVVAFAILCNESKAEETNVGDSTTPSTQDVKSTEPSGEHGKAGKGKGGKERGKGGRKGGKGGEGKGRKGKRAGGKGKSDEESNNE